MANIYKGPDIEDLINLIGLTEDRLQSRILNFNRININKIFSYTDAVNYGKMYAFFTKPDLNIFIDSKGTVNPSIRYNCPDLYAKIMANPLAASQLQSSTSANGTVGGQGFMNILGSLCNSIDVPDITLSLKEGPVNSKGQGVKYGGDFNEALTGEAFNIGFVDTRNREVQTMIEIWLMYIEAVNNGTIDPKRTYIGENRIDYAISIYIFTLDETYNILNSVCLTGCFPTGLNMQLAQYSPLALEADKFIGPFQYPWYFSYISLPNVNIIHENFNYVSGWASKVSFKDGENANQYMYRKKGSYYIHNGVIVSGAFILPEIYPYTFDLYNFWAEIAGISYNMNSSGVMQYVMVFASSTFKNQKVPTRFDKMYANPVPYSPEQKGDTRVDFDRFKKMSVPLPHRTETTAGTATGADHAGIVKRPTKAINGPKFNNLQEYNVEYQKETEEQWSYNGFGGWGQWKADSSGRYTFGNENTDDSSNSSILNNNAAYAKNFLQNLTKLFNFGAK